MKSIKVAGILDQLRQDRRSQRRDAGKEAEVRCDQTRYTNLTDAGPLVKEDLRREICDLFIENEKRRAKQALFD